MSYIRVRETKRRFKGKPIRRYQAIWTENGKEFRETFDSRDLAQDKLENVKLRKAGLVISDRRGMNVFHRVRPEALQALCVVLDPTCST